MFPDIVANHRLVAIGDRAVLVRRGNDLQRTLLVHDEPGPAAAESSDAGGLELGLELINAAEGCGDRLGQFADGCRSATRGEQFPEEGVVGVTAAIVADGITNAFGNSREVGDQLVHGLGGQLGVILQRIVEVIDISSVMLVMMDFHRARIDVWLERVEGVG